MGLLKKTSLEEDLSILDLFAKSLKKRHDGRPDWLKNEVDESIDVALYYRFLYEVSKLENPPLMLETGTRHGHSAAHLAMGNPAGTVVTIDIEAQAKIEVDAFELKNIRAITSDSVLAVDQVVEIALRAPGSAFDLMFIDSAHFYPIAASEYRVYRPKLRHGAIILCDDIHINADMERFWASIEDPKVEMNFLHYMGFGVALKDSFRDYRG